MKFIETKLKGVYLIQADMLEDSRGAFFRTYCEQEFKQIGHHENWLQANQSITTKAGTLRGLHYQQEPFAEIKLIRCLTGAVHDVLVDLRKDSRTFLQYLSVELSAQNHLSLYVPKGLAHGFQTLTNDVVMTYLHSAPYQKLAEGALRYNDPLVNIKWPMPISEISERDLNHPLLPTNFAGL